MFKKHPKGLVAASLSNMGERFGFYTMMALLVLFLLSKYGLSKGQAGLIYSIFYFCIYAFALIGGIIADKTRKYKSTIMAGIILMGLGYVIIAYPTPTPTNVDAGTGKAILLTVTCIGLFVIAFGNGLFKGNLQALVGQMYDNPQYEKQRDSGFSLFYMFINVGAIFAPILAVGIRNWWLKVNGFKFNQDLPVLCHDLLNSRGTNAEMTGQLTNPEIMDKGSEFTTKFATLAQEADLSAKYDLSLPTDMSTFAVDYLEVFNTGFHYAFGIAIIALVISLIIYYVNKKKFPDPASKKVIAEEGKENATSPAVAEMSTQEIRQRIYALLAVFGVVIFFWFSFHQNGLTLTYFANDYTDLSKFSLDIFGLVTLEGAELFQSFNPLFVVVLTPLVLAIFGYLRAKGSEPSSPKKIMIGMGIAAIAYVVMTLGSMHVPSQHQIQEMYGGVLSNADRVTPWLLIGTYFVLTVAELFISPLGLSFVSKVSPPQYQGVMQGLWLMATALGNQLLFIGALFYESIPIWTTWLIFVGACLISMFTMLFMLGWLERITKDKSIPSETATENA